MVHIAIWKLVLSAGIVLVMMAACFYKGMIYGAKGAGPKKEVKAALETMEIDRKMALKKRDKAQTEKERIYFSGEEKALTRWIDILSERMKEL